MSETFRSVYEYEFLAFELVMLTTRSSTVPVANRRTATRYDPATILRTPVKNFIVPRSRIIRVVKSEGRITIIVLSF